MSVPRHGLVLLAAGVSRRLGQAKQLIVFEGETLVHRAARLGLATSPVAAVVVVADGADAVAKAVADLPLAPIRCAAADAGMGISLRAGLSALPEHCAGALVLLCDQPALTEAHLHALVAAWRESPACAAASRYDGQLGVPALLPRTWFNALAALSGDAGARTLLRSHATDVKAVPAEALAQDIDTPGALAALGTPRRQE